MSDTPHTCNAVIERGRWCYYCLLPFGHASQHEHTEIKWEDGAKGSEPANLAGMSESFRVEYETGQLRAEIERLKRVLSEETSRANAGWEQAGREGARAQQSGLDAIHAEQQLAQSAPYAVNLRRVLESIARFPRERAEELSADGLRGIARAALDAYPVLSQDGDSSSVSKPINVGIETLKPSGSDGEEVRSLAVGGAQLTQGGGDSTGMPLSVGRSRPDQTATSPTNPMTGSTNRLIAQTEGWTPAQYCARIAALERERHGQGTAPQWRHVKRGTVYTEVCRGLLQVAKPVGEDGGATLMIIYRGEDGQHWVREFHEFMDGRFKRLDQYNAPEVKP